MATIRFDLKCVRHAATQGDLCLTLGYNTAVFTSLLKARGVTSLINMDGVEWRRSKWPLYAKAWLFANDWIACKIADHLIADHPSIATMLARRTSADRLTCIPYGATIIEQADPLALPQGLVPGNYVSVVARSEPENSILEIVRAFSRRPRGVKLVVIGAYYDHVDFHRAVKMAAGPDVVFAGSIYDARVMAAIRRFSLAYVHGHRVGGTNPSLLEAMGAGNAVIAHDNPFNRWVASDAAVYFSDEDSIDTQLDLVMSSDGLRTRLASSAAQQVRQRFGWEQVLCRYHDLLLQWAPEAANCAPGGKSMEVAVLSTVDEQPAYLQSRKRP